MSRAPAFQMYVADFLSDPEVDLLTPEELGGYVRLLLIAWQQSEPGFLPLDDAKLSRWSRLGRRWKACREAVLGCFKDAGGGRIFQRRMVLERHKQVAYRDASSRGGKQSAEAKKAKQAELISSTLAQPLLLPSPQTPSEGQHSDLHSSSSSSSSTPPTRPQEEERHERKPGELQSFQAWWGMRTGILMAPAFEITQVHETLQKYAGLVEQPFAEVADKALDAYEKLSASWSAPQGMTTHLFLRKWEAIQAEMARKVPKGTKEKEAGEPDIIPSFKGKAK